MPSRSVSILIGSALLGPLLAAGCIKRSAAPALAGAATAAASPAPAQTAALEAANARIAGVDRVDLLGGAGAKAFVVSGEVAKVVLTQIQVAGQPFSTAVRAEVKEASGHEWAVQLRGLTTAAVDAGDVLLATFYLRTETPQEGSVGETEFVLELAESPFTKSVSYPIQVGRDWTKVQVRFQAAQHYGIGQAQILFRLGYEPEVLDIGGVSVESFGKRLALSALPSTLGEDRRRERAAAATVNQMQPVTTPVNGGELRFEINPSQVIGPISPYVYGINSQKAEGVGATVKRTGGNTQTAYNWENNAANAGSDYNHFSHDWPCTALGYRDCDQPGAQFLDFAIENRKAGVESIVTIPMVDYVAADKHGAVAEKDKAPSSRWNRSFAAKPGPFAPTPDLSDGNVYQDEFVNFLTRKLGPADKGGIRFYSLDNEPALWPSTHPRVHPDKTRYDEMVARTEATAGAITKNRSDRRGPGRRGVRLVRIHDPERRSRCRRAQSGIRHLPGFLPRLDEIPGGETPPQAGSRAGRALVSGGERNQADHRERRVAEDRRRPVAGAAQPVGSDVCREELDHRGSGANRSG